MLLAAIEDDFRPEMVNRRICDSPVGILYQLMTPFVPGGKSEKILTLSKLQHPTQDAWMPSLQQKISRLGSDGRIVLKPCMC